MNESEVEYQAEKLMEFIRRGGNRRVWMRSKGWRKGERYAVERQVHKAKGV